MGILKNLTDEYFGKKVRTEDEREYVDFGEKTTVLWAKYALEINEKRKFHFDEVKNFNKNDWRLPTRKEVKQLFSTNKKNQSYYFSDGMTIIYFNSKDKNKNLIIKEHLPFGFSMWTQEEDKEWQAPSAWSYGFNNSCEFRFCSLSTSLNVCYVFLVKDKIKE